MRNLLISLVALCALLLVAAVPMALRPEPVLTLSAAATDVPAAILAPAPAIPADLPVDSAGGELHEEMKQYVLWVMGGWTRAVPSEPVASYDDIADDIASAANGNAEDAVLLAGLGYFEGARYAAYVDGYGCNNAEWRKSDEGRRLMRVWGDCDGGRANSIWQVHPIVDRSTSLYSLCRFELIGPMGCRFNAARCALAIAHASMQATGDLSGYTGEPMFAGGHPKADQRLAFVRAAIAKHPWSVLTKE